MVKHFDYVVIGQGLAGSAVAWTLHWAGKSLLIVDQTASATASRVSAGLITPLTGKRLVKPDDFDECWQTAQEFYGRVERETGASVLTATEMLRCFANADVRDRFLTTMHPDLKKQVESWDGRLQTDGDLNHGIKISGAGRLAVTQYLQSTRAYFEDRGEFEEGRIDVDQLCAGERDSDGQFGLPSHSWRASSVIVCTGASGTRLFPDVPNNPSRGDILRVRIPDYDAREVVHRSIWIAPASGDEQYVGSTYDWKHLKNEPTASGREQLLASTGRLVKGHVEVLDQQGAIRPTMKDFKPVIGRNSDERRILILNGLGSKGALRAPLLARMLKEHVEDGKALPERYSHGRLVGRSVRPQPLTTQAQRAVAEVLEAGDTAIDATVGNGFDTSFLADAVGQRGTVIGYDRQQSAIDSTRRRLLANEKRNAELRLAGHQVLENISEVERLKAVMFNLGYLPGSDKSITTSSRTSIPAIRAAVRLLAPEGILTVLSYRGHEGGPEEYEAVERLLTTEAKEYDWHRIDSDPPKTTSPVLFVLRKRARQ